MPMRFFSPHQCNIHKCRLLFLLTSLRGDRSDLGPEAAATAASLATPVSAVAAAHARVVRRLARDLPTLVYRQARATCHPGGRLR